MKSLGELDDPVNMRVRAAMSDDMRKDADKSYADAVMSSETSTYWLTPEMSYVDKEFAAVDPGFATMRPPLVLAGQGGDNRVRKDLDRGIPVFHRQ